MSEHMMPSGASIQLGPYAAVFAPLDAERPSRCRRAPARRLDRASASSPTRRRCPPRADLAERFGVATVTVREALQRAAPRGPDPHPTWPRRWVLRLRAGRRRTRGPARTLAAHRIGEWRDLADHYATVSGGCARLAAGRADDGRRRSGCEVLARREPTAARAGIQRLEAQFHLDLAATAQSARLTREEMALQAELGPVLWLAALARGLARAGGRPAPRHRRGCAGRAPETARAEAESHVGELFGALRRMVVQARRRR